MPCREPDASGVLVTYIASMEANVSKAKPSPTTSSETGTVRLHRVLAAPPEKVYRAFTDHEPYCVSYRRSRDGFPANGGELYRAWYLDGQSR